MIIQPPMFGSDHKVDLKPADLIRKYRNAYPHIHKFEDLLEQIIKGEFEFWKYLHTDVKIKLVAFMGKVTDMNRRFQEMEANAKKDL